MATNEGFDNSEASNAFLFQTRLSILLARVLVPNASAKRGAFFWEEFRFGSARLVGKTASPQLGEKEVDSRTK